jgi:hypothetical protein
MKKVVAALAAVAAAIAVNDTRAATPPSGSVSTASGTVSWSYGAVVAGTVVDTGVEDICPPGVCDNFDLTVSLPQPAATFYQTNTATLTLTLSWTSTVASDLDLFAYAPNGAKYGPGSPDTTATGPNSETLTITDPIDGVWHVRSVASLVPVPVSASGSATLTAGPRPSPDIEKQPAGAPLFSNYPAPENITPAIGSTTAGQHGAGEPSIGVNWKTGATFIQAGNHSLRVIWNDATSPAGTTWTDQRSPFSRVSLDPILWTDSTTGRTVASQLDLACSEMSFTDDDGNTWTPTQGCGVPAGPDHQTVGGGNWAAPKPLLTTGYPHAVYYCSQGIADAICARSDDGGLTFGPGVPIYNITQCGGLHGHIRVSPDGTAYVPNHNCQDAAGVARDAIVVTPDNGLTWIVRTVPGSKTSSAGGDPSVAAGANNTLYFGFVNYDGHPKVAVSHDHGATWSKPFDAGTYWDLQNAEFAEVIAGDDDRAAFAFLGTTTPGDDQSAAFNGVWHLYVATTYDGGKSWTTGDVTPTDPVQRGCIWNGGGSNPCRNLLDFNDITTDNIGRVLVGYADGCTGSCVNDPTANASTGPSSAQDALATIARQATGKTLFGAFDSVLPK